MQLLVPGGRTSCLKKVKRSHVWIWYQLLCYFYPKGRCMMCFLFIFVMCNTTCLSLGYFSPNCSDFNFVLSRYETPRNSPITHQDLKTHKTSRCFRNRRVNPIKSLTKRPRKFHLRNHSSVWRSVEVVTAVKQGEPSPKALPVCQCFCRFNGHWDGSGGTNILDHWNILVFVLRPALLKCTLYACFELYTCIYPKSLLFLQDLGQRAAKRSKHKQSPWLQFGVSQTYCRSYYGWFIDRPKLTYYGLRCLSLESTILIQFFCSKWDLARLSNVWSASAEAAQASEHTLLPCVPLDFSHLHPRPSFTTLQQPNLAHPSNKNKPKTANKNTQLSATFQLWRPRPWRKKRS